MQKNKFEILLAKEESSKLDFKQELLLNTASQKKELAKDISAIANSYGGRGYIIFGIEDKRKKILGIKKDENLEEKIQQIVANRIEPPVPIRLEFIEIDKKQVAILTIFKSNQKPHQILQTGAFHIRRGSTTDIARRYEILRLFELYGMLNAEQMPVYFTSIKDINFELVYLYLKKINLQEDIGAELLEALGILARTENSEICASLGGLLVFGYHPQKFLSGASVKIILDLENLEIKIFQGNILFILDEIEDYIKWIFKDIEYPLEAIFEAIRNSLVHRDYFIQNKEISVYIGKNKIEITNPGALIEGENIKNILREKSLSKRNSWIYEKLMILDSKKRFLQSGMGLKRIQRMFISKNKVKIENNSNQNIFKVILPGVCNTY